MKKNNFASIIFLIIIIFAYSCEKEQGNSLVLFRDVDKNTMVTKNGIYLRSSFIKSSIIKYDKIPSQVDVISYFDVTDTSIAKYGHCWSIVNKQPTLNDTSSLHKNYPKKTAKITIGGENGEPEKEIEAILFRSNMMNMRYLTEYYVRPYMITQGGDTAYGPVINKFKTTYISDSWSRLTNLFEGRKNAISFSINGKGYIGTGENSEGEYFEDLWMFDPERNIWTQKNNLGKDIDQNHRKNAVAFVINGKGYVGTGETKQNEIKKDFYAYSPESNTWRAIKNFHSERTRAVAFVIADKAYVGLGEFGNEGSLTARSDFYSYDPSKDVWTAVATYKGGRRAFATAFSIEGKGYVFGGTDETNKLYNDFYHFDPGNGGLGNWVKLEDLPAEARKEAVSFSINGKGYVGTGETKNGKLLRDIWEYNPKLNKERWIQKKDFGGEIRKGAVGFSIGERGYISTGYGKEPQGGNFRCRNDIWEYLPDSL